MIRVGNGTKRPSGGTATKLKGSRRPAGKGCAKCGRGKR